jgi:hypothetical protein
MSKSRNSRKNRSNKNKKSGAGYLSPAEFFNPAARQPSSTNAPISSAPVTGWVRPPMAATISGGRRSRRSSRKHKRSTRKSGGFSPSIMGSFVSNVQSAIVPVVIAGLYGFFGTKKNTVAKPVSKSKKGGRKSKNSRNNRK